MRYTDEQYAMIEDIKTRKDIARSAKHIKNGSKSKKCSLPSDYLTKKEKEQMNGELKTVNLNVPMEYKDFKELSARLKKEYVEHLRDAYHARKYEIADMLGTSHENFRKICGKLYVSFPHGGISNKFRDEHAKEWQAFLNGEFDKTVKSDIEIASPSKTIMEMNSVFAENFEKGLKEAQEELNVELLEDGFVLSKDICDALEYGVGSEEAGWIRGNSDYITSKEIGQLNPNDIYTGATKIDCDFCRELEANRKYSNRKQVRRDFHKSLTEYLKVVLDDILDCNCVDSETEYIRFIQLFELHLFNEVRTVRKEK